MIDLLKKVIKHLLQKRIDVVCNKKIKRIYQNINPVYLSDETVNNYRILWGKFKKKPSIKFLEAMVSISRIESSQYVPENIHYGIIEPRLNNKLYALTYNDKNFFERFLSDYKTLFPHTILRGINGKLFDTEFNKLNANDTISVLDNLNENDELIIKPAVETGGGSNVRLIVKTSKGFAVNDSLLSRRELIGFFETSYHNNFVLQYKLIECPWFIDFNKDSLNTVRMYCYRSVLNEEIHPLHAYIRFGQPGSLVDSSSQGGRTCGVKLNGMLNDFAIGKYGEKYSDLPVIQKHKGNLVPRFDDMKRLSQSIAKHYYYHRLLGFDFCVDKDNSIRLMEVNTMNIGIINQQMNTGPLFQKFTDEIVEFCLSKKKSIVLDFYA